MAQQTDNPQVKAQRDKVKSLTGRVATADRLLAEVTQRARVRHLKLAALKAELVGAGATLGYLEEQAEAEKVSNDDN